MITIRKAEVRDLQTVAELLLNSFIVTYKKKKPEFGVTEKRRAELMDLNNYASPNLTILAEKDSIIIGTVTLTKREATLEEGKPFHYTELKYLAVDPQYQGQNIGAVLVEDAIKEVRLRNGNPVIILIRKGLENLVSWYETLGFVRFNGLDKDYGDNIILQSYKYEGKAL